MFFFFKGVATFTNVGFLFKIFFLLFVTGSPGCQGSAEINDVIFFLTFFLFKFGALQLAHHKRCLRKFSKRPLDGVDIGRGDVKKRWGGEERSWAGVFLILPCTSSTAFSVLKLPMQILLQCVCSNCPRMEMTLLKDVPSVCISFCFLWFFLRVCEIAEKLFSSWGVHSTLVQATSSQTKDALRLADPVRFESPRHFTLELFSFLLRFRDFITLFFVFLLRAVL